MSIKREQNVEDRDDVLYGEFVSCMKEMDKEEEETDCHVRVVVWSTVILDEIFKEDKDVCKKHTIPDLSL